MIAAVASCTEDAGATAAIGFISFAGVGVS
jgi:hypothetical protein